MRVSFDFDSTLSREDVQKFAKELVKLGHEVWIVTSRFSEEEAMKKNWHWIRGQNQTLFDIANQCGIKPEHIKFTCMESKSIFLKDKDFIFHVDDDEVELMDIIDSGDKCKAINVEHNEWQSNCLQTIDTKQLNDIVDKIETLLDIIDDRFFICVESVVGWTIEDISTTNNWVEFDEFDQVTLMIELEKTYNISILDDICFDFYKKTTPMQVNNIIISKQRDKKINEIFKKKNHQKFGE